jgi:protein-tyrosine sulfotransferase
MEQALSGNSPIFILSCHRSGSTLLRFILDTHPVIYSPPEIFLGNAAFAWATFLAGLHGKLFEPAMINAQDYQEILVQIQQLIDQQMSAAVARKGKRIWCEKTPDNMDHLELIDALFPRARYLCLYRHCLDVVKSGIEISDRIPVLLPFLYSSRGHLVTALIRYWTEWNSKLQRFEAARPQRCHRLYYESLVSDPKGTLASLFSFLELDWDEGLVDAVFAENHDVGVEDFKARQTRRIHHDSLGRGSDVSLGGVPEKSLEEMRRLLTALGYPPAPGAGAMPQAAREPQAATARGLDSLFEEHLRGLLLAEPQLAQTIGMACQFAISGDGGGHWIVDLRQKEIHIQPGVHSADCTIHISATDLRSLLKGGLGPIQALREGRIRLEGMLNIQALQSLLELLRRS